MPELLDGALSKQRYVYAALAAYLGSLSIGTTLGYSSPTSEFFAKEFHDGFDKSLFGSVLTIGALFGGLFASVPAERFGRKTTIMGTTALFSLGWVLILFRTNPTMIYAARCILGIASGINCMIIPVYLGEVSSVEKRGVLGTGHQLSIVVGIFIIYCLGALINPTALALACSLPVVCNAICMLFVPESPAWLVKRNKPNSQIMDSLYFLFGRTMYAEAQREVLTESKNQNSGNFNITSVVSPSIFQPLILAMSLMFLQQLSGINAIIFYTKDIFSGTKTNLDENVEAIIIAGIQVVFTIPAAIVIDRAGRRLLLFISGISQIIGLSLLVSYYLISVRHPDVNLSSLPVIALSLYVAGFSIGYGPIPWLMMGELLPVRARGIGTAMCTAFNWLCAFLVTKYFPTLKETAGDAAVYSIFLGIILIGIVYIFMYLPETKGKSLEEIEAIFQGPSNLDESVVTVESSNRSQSDIRKY